jgi:hypothetical protein
MELAFFGERRLIASVNLRRLDYMLTNRRLDLDQFTKTTVLQNTISIYDPAVVE